MIPFWRKHWFLTTLGLFIACGMALGIFGYEPVVRPAVAFINPRWTTACVLFLMSFSLESNRLWAAFRAPRPVLLGAGINFGLVPLLAWALALLQQHPDFRLGLMIAASVPCTTAAASVMTRKARGNDAISLLVTMGTNVLCFVLTPLWLQWTTSSRIELDTQRLMVDLVQAVLVPTVLGQTLRQPRVLHDFAVRHNVTLGVAAQILIEVLVLTAALHAGARLHPVQPGSLAIAATRETPTANASSQRHSQAVHTISAADVFVVWSSCVAVHLASLAAGWLLARRTGSSQADAAAVAFAGSQKTLPIGLYIATDQALFGSTHPFAVFPMLLYHASQLFIDTWLASQMAAHGESKQGDSHSPVIPP